jgi:head-tail adaptor
MSSFRKPQTIIRKTPGKYVDGVWHEGAEAPLPGVTASVQPAKKEDYDMMEAWPEGRRVEAMVRIYTSTELKVAGADNSNGDILEWRGSRYLIRDISPWQSDVINHFRYLAVRI